MKESVKTAMLLPVFVQNRVPLILQTCNLGFDRCGQRGELNSCK